MTLNTKINNFLKNQFATKVSINVNYVYPNKKLIGYTYLEQVKDLMPSFILAALMGCVVFLVGFVPINIYIKLVLQLLTGAFIYVFLAWRFKVSSFLYLTGVIKRR